MKYPVIGCLPETKVIWAAVWDRDRSVMRKPASGAAMVSSDATALYRAAQAVAAETGLGSFKIWGYDVRHAPRRLKHEKAAD